MKKNPSIPKILVLLLVLLLTACGGSADEAAEAPMEAPASGESVYEEVEEASESEAVVAADRAAVDAQAVEGEAGAQAQAVDRKIIYTGSMQIRVDEPRATAMTLQAMAQRYNGYVSNANVFEVREDEYRASVQLRIPAENFDAVMAELRELGTEVLNESIGTQDVTDQYVDLEARIENLERTEEELQILLTEARENQGETEDILAVYRELTEIRGQIESLQGRLNVLRDQVTLATINVELVPPEAQVEIVDEGWSVTRTVRQALRTLTNGLQAILSLAIYFLIAVAPLLLLAAVVLYALYRFMRWVTDRNRRATPPAPPASAEPTAPAE